MLCSESCCVVSCQVTNAVVLRAFPEYHRIHDEVHVHITHVPIVDKLRDLREVRCFLPKQATVARALGNGRPFTMVELSFRNASLVLLLSSTMTILPAIDQCDVFCQSHMKHRDGARGTARRVLEEYDHAFLRWCGRSKLAHCSKSGRTALWHRSIITIELKASLALYIPPATVKVITMKVITEATTTAIDFATMA